VPVALLLIDFSVAVCGSVGAKSENSEYDGVAVATAAAGG